MNSSHNWEARPNILTFLPNFAKYRWNFICLDCGVSTFRPYGEALDCYPCIRVMEPDNWEIRNDCDCPVCDLERGPPEYETCVHCGGDVDDREHCTRCGRWLWHPAQRVQHYR